MKRNIAIVIVGRIESSMPPRKNIFSFIVAALLLISLFGSVVVSNVSATDINEIYLSDNTDAVSFAEMDGGCNIAFYRDYRSISDTSKVASDLSYYTDALIAQGDQDDCPSVVKFKGTATTDEKCGFCYGSYYCNVKVEELLSNPGNRLKEGDEYAVCYGYNSKSIKTGDKLDVYGEYFYSCGAFQHWGNIIAFNNDYYLQKKEVEFRGKILVDYQYFSYHSFDIKIDKVLDDPTGNLQKGEMVNVYGHRSGPAQVDDITVGDEVDVLGEYLGYVEGTQYERIFLSDYDESSSNHYVKKNEGNSKKVLFDTAHNEHWTIDNERSSGTYETFSNILKNIDYEITEFNFKNLGTKYSSGILLHTEIRTFIWMDPETRTYNFNVPEGTKSIGISINTIKEQERSSPRVTLYDPNGEEHFKRYVSRYHDHITSHIHNPVAGEWKLEIYLPTTGGEMHEFRIDIGVVPTLKEELESNDYGIVILGAPGTNPYNNDLDQFTDEEMDAIVDFVKGGGNLLLIGDQYGLTSRKIAERFGTKVTSKGGKWDDTIDWEYKVTKTEMENHPIFNDVSEFYYYRWPAQQYVLGTGAENFAWDDDWFWNILETSNPVAHAEGDPIIAAFQDGGKLAIIGSGELFENGNIDELDHRMLAIGVMNWLSSNIDVGNPKPNITSWVYSWGWKQLDSFSIYPQAKRDVKFIIENEGGNSNLGYIDISVSKGLDIVSWEDDSSGYMSYENLGPNSNNPTDEASYGDGSRRVPQFELLSGYKPFGSGEKNTVTVTVKATGEGEQWIKYRASMESSDGYVRDPSSGGVDQQGWHAQDIAVTVDGIQPDVVIPIDNAYVDWISIGDLNGDDLNDIVMENGDVFYQQLDNSFLADKLGLGGITICTGKINNDDLIDIVTTGYRNIPDKKGGVGFINISYQQNDKTFKDAPDLTIKTSYYAGYCQIDDINGDSLNDVLVTFYDHETSTKIYYQKEDGSFSSTPDVDATWLSGIVSLSDFNQDGLKDLVGKAVGTWGPVVYYQSPDHTFDSTYDERMTHLPFSVHTLFKGMGDVDGNGLDDITYSNNEYPYQSVVYSQLSSDIYVAGRDVNSIDISDLNDDGQNDVAILYEKDRWQGPAFIGIYYQKYVMKVEILSPTDDFSVLKDSNAPIKVKVTYEGEPITGASLVRASFSNWDSDVILTGGVNGIYAGTWTPTNTIGGQVETPVEITVEASHGTLSKGYAKVDGIIEDGDVIKVEILSPDVDFHVLECSNIPIKVRLTNKGEPITGASLVRASFSNGDSDVILTGGENGLYIGSWTPTNTLEGQDETPVEITIEATHGTLSKGYTKVAGVISNEYMYVSEIRKRLLENPDDIVNKDIKVHAFVYSNVSFSKTAGSFIKLINMFSKIFPGQIDDMFPKVIDYEGDVLTFYVIAGDLPGENDLADRYPISFIVASFPFPIKPGIESGSVVEINGEVKEGGAIRYYLEPDLWPPGIKYDPPNSLFIPLPKLHDNLDRKISDEVSTMGFISNWYRIYNNYYWADIYCDGDDGRRKRIHITFHTSEVPDTGLTLITGTIVDDPAWHCEPYIRADSIEIRIKSNKKVPDMVSASTDCPVHLHAYDAQGRHVGVNATGGIDFEIPDAYHSGIDSDAEEIIILNQSEGIRFSVVAIDQGEFNLTIIQSTDVVLKETFYQNIPISETTVATVDVNQANPTYAMEIDDNGDGAPENTIAPDSIEIIGQIQCPLDMNDDNYVNAQDIVYLLTHGEWGNNQGHVWDLNDDGYVNAQDVVYALTHGQWGACP
jgi:hypothetical protein